MNLDVVDFLVALHNFTLPRYVSLNNRIINVP
jgi:hypothetical protein